MEILLLVSLVFAPLSFAAVEPWAYGLLQAVFFGMAAFIFISGRANYSNPLYKNLLPAVLAVAAVGLLQSITENPINSPSVLVFTVWRPATLNAVVLWLFYAAVLYCVPQIITTPDRFKRLLWTIFATGVFIALMGMLQKTGENTLVYGLRRVQGHPFGPFVNRDHAAHFLVMAAMAGLGLFFSGLKALLSHQSRTRYFDLLAAQLIKLVMIAAVVYGVYRTGSRGALHSFAFISAAAGFAAAGTIKTKKIKIAACVGLIVLMAGYGLFVSRNKTLLGLEGDKLVNSVTMRFSIYESGERMFRDFPVLGAGLGAFEYAFPYYKLSGVPEEGLVLHAHSDWLELFLQVGLAGGLIYLAGFLSALYFSFRTWAGARSFTIRSLCGGALGAVAVASTHNLMEFGSQMPANALIYYVLLGALASKPAHDRSHRSSGSKAALYDDEETPEFKPAPLRYAAPAAVGALLLIAWSIPQFMAWRYDQLVKTATFGRVLQFRNASLKWSPDPEAAFRLGREYYNQGLNNRAYPCSLFYISRQIIEPYLRRVPVDYYLNRLDERLRGQLAYCYDPRKIKVGSAAASPRASSP